MTIDTASYVRADSRGLQRLTVVMLAITTLAAFALGVPALVDLALHAGAPVTVAWAAPVVIDGGLAVAALAWAIRRAQGRDAVVEASMMATLVLVSMAAQATHALSVADWVLTPMSLSSAVVLAAAPGVVWAATHALIRSVLREKGRRAARPQAAPAKPVTPRPVAQPRTAPTPTASEPRTAVRRVTDIEFDEAVAEGVAGKPVRHIHAEHKARGLSINRDKLGAAVREATA